MATAPSSSANLGPGFDALAVALSCHVTVMVGPSGKLIVRSLGEGSGFALDRTHLAAQVVQSVLGHDRFEVVVESSIPVARGLGSSAALAVAAAAAAGADDPLAVGTAVDGHPENAAASVVGGLVSAAVVHGRPVAARHPLDPALRFVVVVPERTLSTERARAALPPSLDLAAATFNLGRMGLLLAGLADSSLLSAAAFEDRLHQPYRSSLFPEAEAIMDALRQGGAVGACWSGAGPSLLAVCGVDQAPQVQHVAEEALAACSVPGAAVLLDADHRGLVVRSFADRPDTVYGAVERQDRRQARQTS
ncbi:MAG: homoserine kinase [Actinomycetota bacterium]|nr:homoserine kinase [Actinomycetota bacterium]